MKVNLIPSAHRAVSLALLAGIFLVGCKGSSSEEESSMDLTGHSFHIVKDAAELDQDFVLVFSIQDSNFGTEEERLKFAISRAEEEGVDAVIIGTESRGPDMGDCDFDGKEMIRPGTLFGVRYVAESDRDEYRRQKRSCAVGNV